MSDYRVYVGDVKVFESRVEAHVRVFVDDDLLYQIEATTASIAPADIRPDAVPSDPTKLPHQQPPPRSHTVKVREWNKGKSKELSAKTWQG